MCTDCKHDGQPGAQVCFCMMSLQLRLTLVRKLCNRVCRLYTERTQLNEEIMNSIGTDDFDGTVTADGSDATRTMVRLQPLPPHIAKP